jgi:tRNA C32,U32 (ribose-2'-O)-methylase TrmJ
MGEVERMLDRIGFFKGDQHENVVRTLRHLIRKADPDEQELATLWGILSQVERVAPAQE